MWEHFLFLWYLLMWLQGSVLDSLLFIYTIPLLFCLFSWAICYLCADDMQLFLSFCLWDLDWDITHFHDALKQISSWLTLSSYNTVFSLVGLTLHTTHQNTGCLASSWVIEIQNLCAVNSIKWQTFHFLIGIFNEIVWGKHYTDSLLATVNYVVRFNIPLHSNAVITSTQPIWYLLNPHITLLNWSIVSSSNLLLWKSQIALFAMHHLISGVNFLADFAGIVIITVLHLQFCSHIPVCHVHYYYSSLPSLLQWITHC